MKKSLYNILGYFFIIFFLFYWAAIFILTMPSNSAKEKILNRAPRFSTMFSNSWKLFTAPFTSNPRLYFIVRDINNPDKSDTLEVLANISLEKQNSAPFNQKENIIDHLVNNYVAGMVKTIWGDKKKPSENEPDSVVAAYISQAIASVEKSTDYKIYLGTLNNFCRVVLKDKKIDIAGKEVKIVIKEKMIRPFKEITYKQFLQKEILVFETPFKPLNQ